MIGGLKPYSEMKDSRVAWLGKVPAHWELLPAFAVYKSRVLKNTGMVEKTVLSLSYGRIVVKPEEKLRGLVPESFETYQIVDAGNIIVRTTDLQNDRKSLRIGHAKIKGIITSAYMCLESTERVDNEFGYQYLNAYDLLKIIYGYGSGLRQNLDFKDIKRMPVLVPPKDEQVAIVRFLAHADRRIRRAIAARQKLINLLEEQKQAIIHRAVTRGLDPDVRLKPSGIEWLGDVPEHWEGVRLKYVAQVQTGITLGKTYPKVELVERPYLRVANVQAGHLKLTNVTHVQVPQSEADRSTLRIGDVLMTEGGDIDKLGRGCVWRGEVVNCLHQNHVFAVRPSMTKLLPAFLEALMGSQHGRRYFQLTAKQTTNLAATNGTTVGNFPLLLPRTDEQQCILNWLEERTMPLAEVSARASREISLLREYRTRLIADVVTGKVDVREAAARLPDQVEMVEVDLDEELTEGGDDIDGEGEAADTEDIAA